MEQRSNSKINDMKKIRKPQAPKRRNWVAKTVRDLDGPYRPKIERDKTQPYRKPKHPKKDLDFGE